MADTQHRYGTFVWREIMTSDVAKSRKFYGALFGWRFEEHDLGGFKYTLLSAGEKGVGGMMSLPAGAPRSHWIAYVSSPDVDASAKRVAAFGGRLVAGPQDVPNMGRFAVLLDGANACFATWKGAQGDMPATQPGLGEFCWEQLNTTAGAEAKKFYGEVLGWSTRAFEADPSVTLFAAGDTPVASLIEAPPGTPAHWLSYVIVGDLAAARSKAKSLGAKVHLEELNVPTLGTISVIEDDVGAVIGLFEPKTA
jgi:hypothetical protein